MLIDRQHSLLLLIDVQTKLAASIPHIDPVVATIQRLIEAARGVQVPVLATEHCPQQIGPTIGVLRDRLAADQITAKVHFAAWQEAGFQTQLQTLERRQVVICGTEAHVCVLQSALQLHAAGYEVYLVHDASTSRFLSDRDCAVQRARQEGVRIVSAEMVMFEWLGRADGPEFRELLPVIKSRRR